jgi:hypothetical protein
MGPVIYSTHRDADVVTRYDGVREVLQDWENRCRLRWVA